MENDGCESEIIVGHYENIIYICVDEDSETQFNDICFFQVYQLIFKLYAQIVYQNMQDDDTHSLQYYLVRKDILYLA